MSQPSREAELVEAYEQEKLKIATEVGLVSYKVEGGEWEFLGSDYKHMELIRRMEEYQENMPF